MKSSISTTGAGPSAPPPTRSFNVLLADGSRLRVTCRDLAMQLRQERNATLKRLRQTRAEALADVADRIGDARIRREFEAAEREMDAAIRRLSKQVRVRPEPRRRSSASRSAPSWPTRTGQSGIVITRHTTSALARRDHLGREGMMLRIRYVRAGGRHASPGCLRRHYRYIAREAAVTLDSDGMRIVLGNIGDTEDKIVDVLDLQERVLRATRKNAKLGFRMIGAFPYGLPVNARREVLKRVGDELFGKRGLPWTAAAHDADPGASVDNPHFHLDYGLLPMELLADGNVTISNDLRTDLDGQEGLRFIRHTVARVMTEVAQEYGLDRSFTALSYRERGMDRDGGEHVGQEGTAAHRRGEHVATIARNEAKQRRAEGRERSRKARARLDALERLKLALAATPAAPSLADEPAYQREEAPSASAHVVVAPIAVNDIPVLVPDVSAQFVSMKADPAPQHDGGMPVASAHRPAPSLAGLPTIIDAEARAIVAEMAPVTATPLPGVPPMPSMIPIAAIPLTAPPIDDAMPSVSPVAGLSASFSTPLPADVPVHIDLIAVPDIAPRANVIASLGPEASTTDAPPAIAATGCPAPYQAAVMLPHGDTPMAPEMAAVPALTGIYRDVSTIAPPVVTLVEPPVDDPYAPTPIIWSIGRQASIDPADMLTEQRLKEALEREEAQRRSADSEEAARRDRQMANAAAFEALRRHDEWLGQDDEGRYTVSDAALRASGLNRADLVTSVAQTALEAIGFAQVDRLDPVLDDRSGGPVFHIVDGVIRLDGRFSRDLCNDVARWSDSPHFRAFVIRIWPELRAALAPATSAKGLSRITAEDQRRQALDDMLAAIAEERHFLGREGSLVLVPPHILARFGLSPADVAGDEARRRIANLADRQAVEVSQIATHVRTSPHDIVPDGEGWGLRDTAPADIRLLVEAWRNDATMQQALGRTVGARSAEAPVRDTVRPSAEDTGDTSRIVRRFPGMPGHGMGD